MHSEFTSFVRSIYGQGFIPLHEPRFTGNEKKYILDAIDSTFVSSVGEYVNRFEKEFAAYIGSSYAVAVMNGTAGLHLALHASGVNETNEVITQPLTFVATCNAISYCHAKPVFVDVDEDTLGMSPTSLSKFFSILLEAYLLSADSINLSIFFSKDLKLESTLASLFSC